MQSAELITQSRDPLTRSCDLFVFDLGRGAFIGTPGVAAAIIRVLVPYAKFSRPSVAPLYASRFSRKCRVPVHALPCTSSSAICPSNQLKAPRVLVHTPPYGKLLGRQLLILIPHWIFRLGILLHERSFLSTNFQ